MITFKKSKMLNDCYLAYDDNRFIGAVRKHAALTVRGDRISWKAYRNGRQIGGSEETRIAAAELLIKN